jgi:hypothetical protein
MRPVSLVRLRVYYGGYRLIVAHPPSGYIGATMGWRLRESPSRLSESRISLHARALGRVVGDPFDIQQAPVHDVVDGRRAAECAAAERQRQRRLWNEDELPGHLPALQQPVGGGRFTQCEGSGELDVQRAGKHTTEHITSPP